MSGRTRPETPAGSAGGPAISSKVTSAFLRVGTLVGATAEPLPTSARPPQSPGSVVSRLTDAELEAEALNQKEISRLEAERILMKEAEDRRRVDERVLQMRRNGNGSGSLSSPVDSSPSTPRKEEGGTGWMSGFMKKLTPTKELTPAQQIINETKAKDKVREKEAKRIEKTRSKEWPSSGARNGEHDPSQSLFTPSVSPAGSRIAPSEYSSINGPMRSQSTPNAGLSPYNPSTPTPASRVHGPRGGSPVFGNSPGEREPTPLYAVFNDSGTLDIPATLITITRRFEKLEKWTVSHVRALEDRMKDVEK